MSHLEAARNPTSGPLLRGRRNRLTVNRPPLSRRRWVPDIITRVIRHAGHHGTAGDNFGRAFIIGIALNLAFVIVETIYGFAANSMALLADAGHNLSDVLGLVVAYVGAMLVKRRPSPRFSYGLKKSSILAALINALLLLVAVGGIIAEAIRRLIEPEPSNGTTVMAVAAVGIVINGLTAWLFARGRHGDINIRGAYLHMVADAAVSAAVVVAGLLILLTGERVDRPGGQPGRRGGDPVGDVGPAARIDLDDAGRHAQEYRVRPGRPRAGEIARRGRHAPSPHLVAVDHRDGDDGPSAGRRRGRSRPDPSPGQCLRPPIVRHRPFDHPGRTRGRARRAIATIADPLTSECAACS